jgi:hypothetical protein
LPMRPYSANACPSGVGRPPRENWGTLPLGGLAGGALGSAIGVHATLWVAAAGGCSSALWLYLSPPRGQLDLPGVMAPAPDTR